MKKQYFKPSMKAYTVKTSAILEESTVAYEGSNKNGGPKVAEGKGYYDDEDWED